MAAVLVTPTRADGHRAVLRGLLYRRQRRLHWRDENDRRRAHLITALAALRLSGVVVVASGLDPKRQERARRKCMERLLWELGARGVGEVVFESRGRGLDEDDRRVVDVMRVQNSVSPQLRVRWQEAEREPLIWIPDIVAGAASLATAGQERFWKELGPELAIERFELN